MRLLKNLFFDHFVIPECLPRMFLAGIYPKCHSRMFLSGIYYNLKFWIPAGVYPAGFRVKHGMTSGTGMT